MEEDSKVSSKYNEASNQIMRLHNLWLKCEACKEQGDMQKYENALRSAKTELKYDANLLSEGLDENHEKNYISKLRKIKIKIKICNHLILKVNNSMFLGAAMNNKWTTLIEKEELLREIQEEAGKGGIRINPLEDDEID